MGKSNLLEEAIADAKAVRETALANARLRMEEAFTPRLQSMISAKLQNEIEGEDEEEIVDEPVEDEIPAEEPVDEVPAEAPVEDVPVEEPVADEIPAEEPVDEVPAEEPVEAPVEEPVEIETEPEVDIEVEPSEEDMEEEGYELDLESIIRELEDESNIEDEIEEPMFTEAKEEGEEEEEEKEELEEAENTQAGMKTDKDVTPNLTGEKGPTPGTQPDSPDRGKPFSTFKGADSTPDALLKQNSKNAIYEEEGEDDEEINLDEILQELEEADVTASIPDPLEDSTSNPFKTMNEQLKAKVNTLSKDLRERRQVIKFLKSKLNEVNLLNAKLLFTSKLFKSNNMNNSEKMKVIESFDRAKTLREVKLVYSTIAESLSAYNKKPVIKNTVKKIAENIGGASKPVIATKPANATKKVVSEGIVSEAGAERLKELAGVNKKRK